MNKIAVSVVAVCLLCCVSCYASKCKLIEDNSGQTSYMYDFGDLGDVSVRNQGFLYKINFCEKVGGQCADDTAICRTTSNTDDGDNVCIGKLSSRDVFSAEPPNPGKAIIVMFGDGDDCGDEDNYFASIDVSCNPDEIALLTVEHSDECYVRFSLDSKYGCGRVYSSSEDDSSDDGDSSTDGGETVAVVILIILIVCVVLYFALGAVYQKLVKQASTPREFVIHNEFWCSLPMLVVDGCKFIGHGFKRGDYVSV